MVVLFHLLAVPLDLTLIRLRLISIYSQLSVFNANHNMKTLNFNRRFEEDGWVGKSRDH